MSIRLKTLVIVGLPVIILLLLIINASQALFLHGFSQIEKEESIKNVLLVSNTLESTTQQLSIKLSDWSSWDDTYKFIKDTNKAYITSNLTDKSLETLQVDIMVFVNEAGEIVQSKSIGDFDGSLKQGVKALIQEHTFLTRHSVESMQAGVMLLPQGPILLAVHPILTSNGEGPVRGTLLFGRLLNQTLTDQIQQVTNLSFQFIPLQDAFNSSETVQVREAFEKGTAVMPLSPTNVVGYGVIKDMLGQPILITRVAMPRTIYLQSQQTLQSFIRVLGFMTAVFAISTILLLEGVILRRLSKLTRQVRNLHTTGEKAQHIHLSGSDELSHLATTINEMEKNLHKSYVSVEEKVHERTEELQKAQARLESSIDSLRIGFVLTDNHNEIVSINGSAKLLLTNKELMSNRHASTESLKKNWTFSDVEKQLKGSFDLRENVSLCLKNTKPIDVRDIVFGERYLHIFISPVVLFRDKEIDILGAAILIEDVTENKIVEKSKDEFFSIASHELRTPLTAIRGNTSLIKDYYLESIPNKEVHEIINDIHDSSIRLITIVNDFLNMSRIEQGRMNFTIRTIDVIPVIDESVKQLETLAIEEGLTLKFDKPEEAPPKVKADPGKLKEALINLMGNALKFTEKGSVTLSVSQISQKVQIKVTDTGRGISEHHQQFLFQKFQQASNDVLTRNTNQGSGLGLYITRIMVQGMGGDVYLEWSEVGKGSVFVIELPVG